MSYRLCWVGSSGLVLEKKFILLSFICTSKFWLFALHFNIIPFLISGEGDDVQENFIFTIVLYFLVVYMLAQILLTYVNVIVAVDVN